VVEKALVKKTAAHRVAERIESERAVDPVAHRETDDAAREQVEDRREE